MDNISVDCNIKQTNFQPGIFTCLKKFKTENEFVDVSINCNGGTLRAHKVVLSSYSPYFYSKLKEDENSHSSLMFNQIPIHIMDALLKFMYEGEVNLDISSVQEFLKTGREFKIGGFPPDETKNESQSQNEADVCNSSVEHTDQNENFENRLDEKESATDPEEEAEEATRKFSFQSSEPSPPTFLRFQAVRTHQKKAIF